MSFDSGFKKREFVITTDDQYPQDVKLELTKSKNAENDKTAVLDKYSIGDRVNVSFDVRGNEYKGRYYVNLVAWKIKPAEGSGSNDEPAPAEQEETDDGMPF